MEGGTGLALRPESLLPLPLPCGVLGKGALPHKLGPGGTFLWPPLSFQDPALSEGRRGSAWTSGRVRLCVTLVGGPAQHWSSLGQALPGLHLAEAGQGTLHLCGPWRLLCHSRAESPEVPRWSQGYS